MFFPRRKNVCSYSHGCESNCCISRVATQRDLDKFLSNFLIQLEKLRIREPLVLERTSVWHIFLIEFTNHINL